MIIYILLDEQFYQMIILFPVQKSTACSYIFPVHSLNIPEVDVSDVFDTFFFHISFIQSVMDTLFKDFNITVSLCTILLLSSIDTLINPGSLRFDFKFFTIRFGCKIYRKQVTGPIFRRYQCYFIYIYFPYSRSSYPAYNIFKNIIHKYKIRAETISFSNVFYLNLYFI